MSGGSWGADTGEDQGTTPVTLDAWARQYVGWTTPVTPSANGTITFPLPLVSQSSSYKFVYPVVTDAEYFLAENRYPLGWDLGMRITLGSGWPGGLLIQHVDTNIGTPASNNINRWGAGAHQGVMAEEANSTLCSLVNSTCWGNSQNLFYSGNNASFTDYTTPSTKYYAGTSPGFGLSLISLSGTTMLAVYSTSPPITFFNDGFEGSGWLTAQVGGGTSASWTIVNIGTHPSVTPHGGSSIARFNSFDAIIGDQARLYTAAGIAIPASYDAVVLRFWMNHDTSNPANGGQDRVQVQVSTNGSTWANLGSAIARYNGTTGWAVVDVDLSAYRGQPNVQIGFLGTSGHGNDIYLDDIAVGGYYADKALIGSTNYYLSLTDAYAAASSGSTIKTRGIEFAEDLLCGQSKGIILDGGYDSAYLNYTGYTVLRGKLTVQSGSITVNRLIIR
jgi:hypothetical protein